MAKYTYRPLTAPHNIRLLRLEPGSEEMPLQATLFHANLDSDLPPAYQAISYVWGCDDTPFRLHTPEGALAISSSLRSALRDLRHETDALVLWADGVCIKQDDNDEKNHQVRLMSHIFSSATSVFAYLGEETGNSNLALEVMSKIGTVFQRDRPKGDLAPKMSPIEWQEEDFPASGSEELKAVAAICDLPWFRRIWIIQELLLAREVQVVCGKGRLNWDYFYGAAWNCHYGARMRDLQLVLRLGVTRDCHIQYQAQAFDLLNLLIIFDFSKSTLAQDRFYALLAIANDANNEKYEIDYGCPLETVIQKYSSVFIANGRLQHLLQFAGMASQCCHLPSWVPDWSFPDRSPRLDSMREQFKAGSKTKFKFRVDSNPHVLFLQGFLLDSVISLSTKYDGSSIGTERYFQELERMTDTLDRYSSREELLYRVPVSDVQRSSELEVVMGVYPNNSTLQDSYIALRKLLRQANLDHDRSLEAQKLEEEAEPFRAAARYFHGINGARGRFCVTRRGYLGVVPESAQVGDIICIPCGMNVPYLLREIGGMQKVYHLVEQVYVHGLMYGEAFEDGVTCKVDGQQIYQQFIELR